jgi:hypothetical protein
MTETTTVEPTEKPDTSSIISAISKGDTVGAGTSFEDVMQQKKQDALNLRKQEFAASLFNAPEVEQEQEPAVEEE